MSPRTSYVGTSGPSRFDGRYSRGMFVRSAGTTRTGRPTTAGLGGRGGQEPLGNALGGTGGGRCRSTHACPRRTASWSASTSRRDPMLVLEGPLQRVRACNAAAHNLLGDRAVIGRPLREAAEDVFGGALLDRYDEAYRSGEDQADDHSAIAHDELGDDAVARRRWRGPRRDRRGDRARRRGGREPGGRAWWRSCRTPCCPPTSRSVPCLDIAARYLLAAATPSRAATGSTPSSGRAATSRSSPGTWSATASWRRP